MKNYQKLYYANYYAQNQNGEYILVSRKECFAPPEEPTAANPYKQRWFYDPEAGYAVRLERSQLGEDTYRSNATSLKSEERYHERKTQCVWKNTKNCDQDCVNCAHKHTSRIVELDKSYNDADGMESRFDLADEADITAILEDKQLLEVLYIALDRLTDESRSLIHDIYWDGKTERELAPELGLKEPKSVNKRKHKILDILRQDSALKNFFD